MPGILQFAEAQMATPKIYAEATPDDLDPRIEALVNDLIGQFADKWTILILEVLGESGTLRLTRLGELVGGISQEMLAQTLPHTERDGLVTGTVHPVVPPKVEYEPTQLGLSREAASAGSGYGRRKTSITSSRRAWRSRAGRIDWRSAGRRA